MGKTNYTRDITMPPVEARSASGLASDTVDLPQGVRSLWISATGNIVVTLTDMSPDDSVTYTGVPAGRWAGHVKRLWSTGTTATVENIEF